MAVLEIKKYPHPVLRKKAKPVEKLGEKELNLIRNMIDTMLVMKGVGLAANQVGENLQIFVASPTVQRSDVLIMINPKIISKKDYIISEEGCLSVPGISGKIKRYAVVEVRGKDINEKEITIKAEGLLARIFQHEIDHLNGKLFIDKLPFRERIKIYHSLRKWKL